MRAMQCCIVPHNSSLAAVILLIHKMQNATCLQHRQLSLPGHNVSISPSPVNVPKVSFSLNNHGLSCHSSSMYLNLKNSCADRRSIQ